MTNAGSISHVRKKFHSLHDLISTSYHEAGHTVYGLLHGVNVDMVEVFETKKTKRINGITYYHQFHLHEIDDFVLRDNLAKVEVGLCYAGLVAEKRFFKMISGIDRFPLFLKEGSSEDMAEATTIMDKCQLVEAGPKRSKYKKKLIKEVDLELAEHWEAVSLVAHALVKKKRIRAIELKKLLVKKTATPEFWKKKFKISEELHKNCEGLDEKKIRFILSI